VEQHPVFALGFNMPSGFEWIVIALALLLIFGRRLPEVMRGLGGSVREFKKGMDDGPAVGAAKPSDAPTSITTPPTPPAPRVEGAVSRDAAPPADNKPT
jgi:TatA/E family protein of Tat protein translocase